MRYSVPTALSFVLLAAVFYRAGSAPLQPVDTWNHFKYGEWIWRHHKLPQREPFCPDYSDQQKRLVDPAWLSEVASYLMYSRFGVEGVALLYGLLEVLKTALLLVAFRRVSRSPWLALAGVACVQAGLWGAFGTFRPQVFGEVCGAAVLTVVSCQLSVVSPEVKTPSLLTTGNWQLATILLLFVLYSNLDASFIVGLFFLAVLVLGRLLERRPGVGWLALAAVLSAAAAFVNPYGPALFRAAIATARTDMQLLPEWGPLVSPFVSPVPYSAWAFAVSVLLVLVTLRYSPRRFAVSDVLLLAMFGLATWFIGRLLPWWMMTAVFVLLPHWREIVASGQWLVAREERRSSLATSHWPLATGLAVAVLLVLLSGFSRRLAPGTPVEVGEQLKDVVDRRPARVFAPLAWSDYLLWQLPPAGELFLYRQLELFPETQLLRYDHILEMRPKEQLKIGDHALNLPDWRTLLDQTGVRVIALSADERGKALFAHLLHGKEPGWQIVYVNEAQTALIAERLR